MNTFLQRFVSRVFSQVAVAAAMALLFGHFLFVGKASAALVEYQRSKLIASDAAEKDEFGASVAIDANIALVGAFRDEDAGSVSGSAYLFNASTGEQLSKLTASDAATHKAFGISVGLEGDTAIIGAEGDDHAGTISGSAYLFDVNSGSQLIKLTASDATAGDSFGHSVGVSGNTAIVGAYVPVRCKHRRGTLQAHPVRHPQNRRILRRLCCHPRKYGHCRGI